MQIVDHAYMIDVLAIWWDEFVSIAIFNFIFFQYWASRFCSLETSLPLTWLLSLPFLVVNVQVQHFLYKFLRSFHFAIFINLLIEKIFLSVTGSVTLNPVLVVFMFFEILFVLPEILWVILDTQEQRIIHQAELVHQGYV